jgi:hypothetical protein
MESRVAALELKLAGGGGIGTTTTTTTSAVDGIVVDADVSSRLDALVRSVMMSSSSAPTVGVGGIGTNENPKRTALHEDYVAINRLLRDLDVSSIAGPTASVVVAAGGSVIGDDESTGVVVDPMMTPMAYRRMEILANADSMGRDLVRSIVVRIRLFHSSPLPAPPKTPFSIW